MDTRREKLEALKKEKNAVIMAHYYVPDEVQEIADYIGDSYYLSDMATKVDASVIVLCGVRFMGESAKILNPGKKVLLPDLHADCPMAHMAAIEKIEEVRKEYPDVAVVCYVNSTAELKSHSDVCVTSSNAVKIVKELPNHDIFFIPDEHLGTYVAEQVPEKHIILNDGFCHVHAAIRPEAAKAAKGRVRRQSFSFTRSAEVKSLHLPITSEAPQASSNMPRQVKIPSFSLQPSLAFSQS